MLLINKLRLYALPMLFFGDDHQLVDPWLISPSLKRQRCPAFQLPPQPIPACHTIRNINPAYRLPDQPISTRHVLPTSKLLIT